MIDVVALGELLIDFTCTEKDSDGYPTMKAHPGGAPANFLAALTKYGAKTAMLGKVGNDAFGRLLVETLQKTHVDTKGLIIADDCFTTLAFVTLDASGDREFSFARKPGADMMLQYDELDLSLIDSAKIFHFGTLSLTDEPARTVTCRTVAYAKSKGKMITYDPNLRKALWMDLEQARTLMLWGLAQADIVKISEDEIDFLFGLGPQAGAEKILCEYGVKLVFVTCGADGCWFRNRNALGHVCGLTDVMVMDTTGAGDIFGGAAVSQILHIKKNPEDLSYEELTAITRFACTVASLSTTCAGGISSIPEYAEVQKRLEG